MVHHLHGEVLVLAGVARRDALVHGLGIDEELEGRARLAHGRYLVVFPRLEVDVAHPGLDMSSLRFDGHEATMHEMLHITDAVHRRHLFLDISILIIEEFNLMGKIEIIENGVLVAVVLLVQQFIIRCLLSQILDEMGNFYMAFVLPGIDIAPMLIESLLHLLHLFDGSFLGIMLHATVEGGVNLQTFGIISIGTVVAIILLTPRLHPVGHRFTEVVGIAVIGILHTIVQLDFLLLKGFALLRCEMTVAKHVVEHHIATTEGILRIDARIIIGGGLEQSYQNGRLVGGEMLGSSAEIGLGSGLDAKGIGTEVNGIGIHGQYLVLIEIPFQLIGGNPLLALHDEHLQARDIAQ